MGCEIKEIRYKDSVIWKKTKSYNFKYKIESNELIKIYYHSVYLSDKKIDHRIMENDVLTLNGDFLSIRLTIRFNCSRSPCNVKVIKNGMLDYESTIDGEKESYNNYSFSISYDLQAYNLKENNIIEIYVSR